MSLFKRKQSKEKDVAVASTVNESSTTSPPSANVPQMANGSRQGAAPGPPGPPGQQAPGPYGAANGTTPPMANGRRMTSNPMQAPPGVHGPGGPGGPGIPNGVNGPPYPAGSNAQSTTSLPPNYSNTSLPGYEVPPNGVMPGPGPGYYPPPAPPNTTAAPLPQRQSSVPSASYPWSTRPIRLYAPQTSPPTVPQSPFPRYGLSVPAFPSHSGHMLLFGGLVHDIVENDLWSMDVRDCTTMPVKTKGDSPMARVGHASAMADRIMLVWGGDTKVKEDDQQDETLYILDLRTQEWTRVPVAPGPIGRYGHAASMHDTRFFVFGGQAEGSFMNDLWAYDIKQLGTADKQHKWEQIQFSTPAPPPRTGHVLVANSGKLYLFGGTDGQYHYNDTWAFDIATRAWAELSCIGYIPVPREGHAAAVVDDVMYVFGGRDVNGKDLGDLAAFRITNQRWYMFQNMGPNPTPRSGHAMVAAHGKIFVVGGEANATSATARDDPSLLHVLDTSKIKYPPDNQVPRQVKPKLPEGAAQPFSEKPSLQPSSEKQTMDAKRPIGPSTSMNSLSRAASPPNSSDRLAQMAQPAPLAPLMATIIAPTAPLNAGSGGSQEGGTQPLRPMNGSGPPQRPRREGDEEYRRAMSPTNVGGSSSPSQGQIASRVTSPTNQQNSPPQTTKTGFNVSVLGTRSPSPRMRMADPNGDRPAPPPDAFYYGRSPTVNAFPGQGRPGSMSGAADLMHELKSKDAEIDAGKKREAALRVIIAKATSHGYVMEDLDERSEQMPNGQLEGDADMVHKLTDALVRLKQEKAAIQNELVAQVRLASDKAMDAERLRRGALQEAAFFRAKAATLESNSPIDLARIEKERINELEKQLGQLHAEHSTAQRELDRVNGDHSTSRELHSAAVQREAETLKRAEEAEEAHRVAVQEMEELQDTAQSAENALRDHAERLVSVSSIVQQREAERDHFQAQLADAETARDGHLAVIEQIQQGLTVAGARTAEMETMHGKASSRIRELEGELAKTHAELEARRRDAETAANRLTELEAVYAKSRQEADSLRSATTSGLAQLLDSHKNMRADDARATRGHQEQIRALEEEGNSLRKMLREAGQRLDAAEAGVSQHRQKTRDLETGHHSLRAEMRTHRTKLLNAQTELAKYKELHSSKDLDLRDRENAVTESEARSIMLRNLLADHGIAVNDNELANSDSSSSRELESKLRDRTRAHETTQREVEELTGRCHEAEDKVESLGRLVERMKDARSPTTSMRSPTPPADSDRRVMEAERKMQELENQHKEKMAALEGDYQTAVRYVKGTEKMLKRMKDELNKQKSANSTLQSEIDGLTGRSSTEPGARTRDASGRGTPSSDGEFSRRLEKLQTQHGALQAELQASRDVQAAREREVDVLRLRCEEAEREVEALREDLAQAQQRINTLLDMGGAAGYQLGSDDEEAENRRRGSIGSSEEASMAFDKFTNELKEWERSRSPANGQLESDDETAHLSAVGGKAPKVTAGGGGHKRTSSDYSGDWVQ